MQQVNKTVFISYRRIDFPWAMCVWQTLNNNGFDVFIDYFGIGAGDWKDAIFENILARAHFVIILTPSALNRCSEPDDMMRQEMEFAMKHNRNIIPLLFGGFQFGSPASVEKLTGELDRIGTYQGIHVPDSFFPAAMEKLRGDSFLSKRTDTSITPASGTALEMAERQKFGALGDKMTEKQEPTNQSERIEVESVPNISAFAEALNRHGNLLLERGEFDGAIVHYSRAILFKSDYANAYFNRARAHYEMKEFDSAINDNTKAIELDPAFDNAYFNRARVHYAKKEFDKAIEDYSNAIRLDPNYSGSFHNRALARKAMKDFEGAIEDYTKVIEFKRDAPDAFMNRAYTYEEKGNFGLAIEDCNEAIRLNKHLPGPFVLRSRLRGKMNDKDGELADSSAALEAYDLLNKSQPGA